MLDIFVKIIISIHAPRTGSDKNMWTNKTRYLTFQSTLPARGATPANFRADWHCAISIHAPRTGSDSAPPCLRLDVGNFNPRSPHGERPTAQSTLMWLAAYFNPRSPHGERRWQTCRRGRLRNFNPRSPHGERPKCEPRGLADRVISIHAPRTGSDTLAIIVAQQFSIFQSTLPARGAT